MSSNYFPGEELFFFGMAFLGHTWSLIPRLTISHCTYIEVGYTIVHLILSIGSSIFSFDNEIWS